MSEDENAYLIEDILSGGRDDLETDEVPDARAMRRTARRRMERIRHQQNLADVIKAPPDPGESIHVVSAAKFDFWTWIPTMIDWLGAADELYCSTWTLNRQNALELLELWDAEKIPRGKVSFLTGLYFKRRETAVYAQLLQGIRQRGGRYRAFRNHCKVLLLSNEAKGHWLSIEGSANLTANPRLEQYVITNDRGLYDFHRSWFEEMLRTVPAEVEITEKLQQKRIGFSQRRAAIGVLTATRDKAARERVLAWKAAGEENADLAGEFAAELAGLIRQWSPVLPTGTVITCPPQGASHPGHYFAADLAHAVAEILGVAFVELVARSDAKTRHGPWPSLEQKPYTVLATAPAAIVVDDLITSGTTMKLALSALRQAGVTAWGFGYNGV